MVWKHSNGDCTTENTTQKCVKVDKKTVLSDFLWVWLYLTIQIMDFKNKHAYKWLKQEPQFENQRTWSHIDQFFLLW